MSQNLDSNGRPVFADGDFVAYNGREYPRLVSGRVVGTPDKDTGKSQVQLEEIDGGDLITVTTHKLLHMGYVMQL